MADRTWVFELDGIQHTVRLKHNQLIDKVQIWADEKLIEKSRRLIWTTRLYPLPFNGHDCAVTITPNAWWHYYRLFVDNLPVPSNADLARFKDRQQWAASVDDFKWQGLGRELGLQYWVDLESPYNYRYRLIGTIDGYLCVLHFSANSQKTIQPVVKVIVRHEQNADAPGLTAKLRADSELQQLLHTTKAVPNELADSDGRFTRFNLPLGLNPDVPLADEIRALVKIVARYVKPTPEDVCDECGQHKPLQIAVLNGVLPTRVCASDLANLGHIGQDFGQQYAQAPSQLGRGMLAGAGVTLASGLILAVALTFLGPLASLLSLFLPYVTLEVMVRVMAKVGTKGTLWSWLMTAALIIGGAIVGTYVGLVGYAVWHYHTYLTPAALWRIAQYFYDTPLVNEPLMMGAAMMVVYLFVIVWQQRYTFALAFHPKIEVLKTR